MEISSNSINQSVSFYGKNTGNNINTAINEGPHLYTGNIFAPEIQVKETKKPLKKKRKSKRLNTMDSDYLPDEAEIKSKEVNGAHGTNNFFIESEKPAFSMRIKKALEHFFTVTPLVNYFFLREKTKKIQKTVETLNDISQNVDDLMNTAVPYGEESILYTDIAKNLTDAASILGKANKEF